MRKETFGYFLKGCILLLALSMSGLTAYATDDEEIIELRGDRYVIHVDRMIASPHSDQRSENPDSEMTLLDVLNTCPEFLPRIFQVVPPRPIHR